MAFDITPYVDKTPAEVRALCRDGVIDFPTAGMCRGYAQANLVILPPEYAADFEEFAKKNPFPCPILEIIKGTPDTHAMGEGGNICTDIPRYRIYENGVFTKELTDVSSYWKEGYVGFLIGCSFSFEETLIKEGIEIRHISQGRNVPMFKTNIQTVPVGPFSGGDYMRWLGYFFIFMGIKMATDGVLRGLGIMRPFLIANMVNLAIRLSVALICAPRFGIDFVWLAVPAGWLANFLVSYAALRKSWPMDKAASAL